MFVYCKKDRLAPISVADAITRPLSDLPEIIYTSNPEDPRITTELWKGSIWLVVTGEIFRFRMTGSELVARIKAVSPTTLVIKHSQHDDPCELIDAVVPDEKNSFAIVAKVFSEYRFGMSIKELRVRVPELRVY